MILGHNNELVRRHLECNLQTRDGWTRFATHRSRVLKRVRESASTYVGGTLCVLGAGNCNDLDLSQLWQTFAEIHLVDIDPEAINFGLGLQKFTNDSSIHVHAPCDITGIIQPLLSSLKTGEKPSIDYLRTQICRSKVLPGVGPFDVVLSAGLLTQLFQSIHDARFDSSSTIQLILDLRRQHIRTLLELAKNGGAVILITDVISTASAPHLPNVPSDQLDECLAELINSQNFFSGTNPVQIRRLLTEDPIIALAVEQVTFHEPWLWAVTEEHQYLTYSVSILKRSH